MYFAEQKQTEEKLTIITSISGGHTSHGNAQDSARDI